MGISALLAIFAPMLFNAIGSASQQKMSTDYLNRYMNMLEQNKSDMRKSITARQQGYLGLEKIIFGRQISNPVDYSNYQSQTWDIKSPYEEMTEPVRKIIGGTSKAVTKVVGGTGNAVIGVPQTMWNLFRNMGGKK